MQRLRVRFTRGDTVKYISHLDITRMWERIFTRAGIRVAYSEGFNPHPRLSLAAPLAVGVTSDSELLDVFVDGTVTPHWFLDAVNGQLPEGIDIRDVRQVSPLLPSLQAQIRQAEYAVEVEKEDGPEDVRQAVDSLLYKDSVPWYHERDTGKREYDLRPLIDEIGIISENDHTCVLSMRLQCDSAGSGRPEQVTKALGFDRYPVSIRRTRLVLES